MKSPFRYLLIFFAITSLSCSSAQTPTKVSGSGLRVAYINPAPAQPIAKDPAVICYDTFDSSGDLAARYFEYDASDGSFVPSGEAGYGGRGRGMKCQFAKGQVGAGSLKVAFGKNPVGGKVRPNDTFHEIYWRVYVQHEPGWEGNPAKLARATCMAGSNWSQGLIAHVWGGKDNVLCIDPASGIRDSQLVTTQYNDFDHLRWLGAVQTYTPIFDTEESGRWVCVESQVKVNTPGKKDGVFNLWIDGKLEATRTDLDWHGTWDEYAINAVFLENYWNQGSSKKQARYFDEFVISTKPIGPIVAASPVTITRTATPVLSWQTQVSASPDDPGDDGVVWELKPLDGKMRSVTLDMRVLKPNTTYWLRLRARDASDHWSEWSDWHAPFRFNG